MNLFNFQFQQAVIFEKNFELITDDHFPYSGWRAGKDKVTDIDRKIVGDVGNNSIEVMDHQRGIALLHQFFIFVEAKINVLFVQRPMPTDDNCKYSTMADKLDWTKVKVAGYPPNVCKEEWQRISTSTL